MKLTGQKCPHCGYEFTPEEVRAPRPRPPETEEARQRKAEKAARHFAYEERLTAWRDRRRQVLMLRSEGFPWQHIRRRVGVTSTAARGLGLREAYLIVRAGDRSDPFWGIAEQIAEQIAKFAHPVKPEPA